MGAKKQREKNGSFRSAKIFRFLLAVIALITVGNLIWSGIHWEQYIKPPSFLENTFSRILTISSNILYSIFTRVLFLIILFQLNKILLAIIRGELFASEIPRRIRWISFSVFAFIPLNLLINSYLFIYPYPPTNNIFLLVLMWIVGAIPNALFGLAILLIADIYARGVTLDTQRKLTI